MLAAIAAALVLWSPPAIAEPEDPTVFRSHDALYGLSLSLDEDLPVSRPPSPSSGPSGSGTTGALTEPTFTGPNGNPGPGDQPAPVAPVASLVAGYKVARYVALIATAAATTRPNGQGEALDPTVGFLFHHKLASGLWGYATITGAAPITQEDLLAGRETTLLATMGPELRLGRLTTDLTGAFAYDLFGPPPSADALSDVIDARNQAERFAAGASLVSDYEWTNRIATGVGGEAKRVVELDGATVWTIRATVARLELSLPGHLSAAAAFVLINGVNGTAAPEAPRTPVANLTLGYTVGNGSVVAGAAD